MITPWHVITTQQRKWAVTRGIKPNVRFYTPTLEENLFQPLNAQTRAEFAAGNGDELVGTDRPARMQSFFSSSAFLCNIFDYWRSQLLLGRSLETLTTALGAPLSIKQMQFRQIYPTGIRDNTPQFDVVLFGNTSKPFLIESTFLGHDERYSNNNISTKSYFPNSGELWGKYGLSRCDALARRINADQEEFRKLNVPQLLKHILGLANTFGKDFTFLYLWYDCTSGYGYASRYAAECAAEYRAEVETFMLRLNGEIDFRVMTYQELFMKMQSDPAVEEKYIAYLAERYFPG